MHYQTTHITAKLQTTSCNKHVTKCILLRETIVLLRTVHNDVFVVIVQWLCDQDSCIGREMRQQASGGRPVDRATIVIVTTQFLAFGERLETVRLKVHNDARLGDFPPVLCGCSE